MIKINIAKNAGFCFGVKRALKIAEQAALKGSGKVYMLGDIVHNEIVVRNMRKLGIRKIASTKLCRCRAGILLIRAHGEPASTFIDAKNLGYEIIDATCPMVKEIHAIARKFEDEGRRVVIIGDKDHDEVRGIIGQLNSKAILINKMSEITKALFKDVKKAGVVVQSTRDEQEVLKMVKLLKEHCKSLVFKNTICNPTKIKQAEARILGCENDIVIIVGSETSANTRRLYEISKSVNRRTYRVNSTGELKNKWFKVADTVGVTAGASTPEESIEAVAGRIKELSLK